MAADKHVQLLQGDHVAGCVASRVDGIHLDAASHAALGAARPAQNFLCAPQSVRRALLTPQVNLGSLYRCDKSD